MSAVAHADVERFGEPVHGPRALTGDWPRFFHLTWNIARNDWKLRFYGSVLGVIWQLIRPLMLFGVLYVFFVLISNVSKGGGPTSEFEGTQLLGSIVLFTFFAEATGGAVRSIVDHEGLVRKIQFPRLVIPASVVLFASFNLCLNLVVVVIFAFAEGVRPMWTWFELPLIVAMLAVFSMGLAMLLSAAFVYFRDIQPIWDVLSQLLFYASPVIIPWVTVHKKLHPTMLHLYEMSPLAVPLQQFRHAFANPQTPSAAYAVGAGWRLFIPVAFVVATFALGFYVFNRVAPRVAEIL